jgi:hypothetical protein
MFDSPMPLDGIYSMIVSLSETERVRPNIATVFPMSMLCHEQPRDYVAPTWKPPQVLCGHNWLLNRRYACCYGSFGFLAT